MHKEYRSFLRLLSSEAVSTLVISPDPKEVAAY